LAGFDDFAGAGAFADGFGVAAVFPLRDLPFVFATAGP
jgi:hypothetical protein